MYVISGSLCDSETYKKLKLQTTHEWRQHYSDKKLHEPVRNMGEVHFQHEIHQALVLQEGSHFPDSFCKTD